MERNIQKNGLINLLALLLLSAAGYAAARVAGSLAGQVCAVFMGLGTLVTAVSWFQMRLEDRERQEKLELDELARSKSGSALFAPRDAEAFPAQRSREQFERFFVPTFTAILFLAEAIGAWFLWAWLSRSTTVTEVDQPAVAIALFGLFALLALMLGIFSGTIARLEHHRLLRPGAGWLLVTALLCAVVAVGMIFVWAGYPKTDVYVARGLCVLLGLIAAETLINLILDIYRPRVKGKVGRPLYENWLVDLLGNPKGLISTLTQAVNYQFGFDVSATWFSRFFRKAIGWLLLAQVAVLFLSTSLVFIDPGEQGLLERFGQPVEGRALLDPGPHLKWPWPIDHVYRYRTDQIQSFNVGFTPDPALGAQNVVLWSVPHSKEENFLVASREATLAAATNPPARVAATNETTGRAAPPVSLLTVSIPVHFQITNLLAWVYHNQDSAGLLQDVATREVVRYLAAADLNEIMSRERGATAEVLRQRIQAAVTERGLGANIVFVGLQDIHPPGKVAPDYEKVVGAAQIRLAKILDAQAEDIKTNALARAAAVQVLNQAAVDRAMREMNAQVYAALFTNRIPAYQAAPTVYLTRTYLETFVRATAKARKYVLLVTNTQDVIQFDLQDKISDDLLGIRPK